MKTAPPVSSVRFPALLSAAPLLLLSASVAHAQGGHGGVARSGMDQGEARISSRSDVRLSMESLPGTSGAQVSALGTRVGAQMRRIRGCYEDTVAEDPTVTGTLRLRILLEERGAPRIEVDRDGVEDDGLLRCVRGALSSIDTERLRRPTRAIVQLELNNSAARGAERAAERAQQAGQVRVTIDAEGQPTTSAGTDDGAVRFTVTGADREAAPAVVSAHRGLLTALPALLDCRRRSARRGRAHHGYLNATVQVREGRPLASRVTRSTVPNPRTRACVNRALRAIERRADAGSGRVSVRIEFAEADEIEAARD